MKLNIVTIIVIYFQNIIKDRSSENIKPRVRANDSTCRTAPRGTASGTCERCYAQAQQLCCSPKTRAQQQQGMANRCIARASRMKSTPEFTRAQQLLRWATVPEQSGPKSGGLLCLFPWGMGPHLTQCRLGRCLLAYQVAS